MRVRDAVAGPHRSTRRSDAHLLERFWFDADAQRAPIGLLSGGERRRLQLLLTLAQKPNVLLLDEPTNDLDLDTLRVLEDFLDEWPGSAGGGEPRPRVPGAHRRRRRGDQRPPGRPGARRLPRLRSGSTRVAGRRASGNDFGDAGRGAPRGSGRRTVPATRTTRATRRPTRRRPRNAVRRPPCGSCSRTSSETSDVWSGAATGCRRGWALRRCSRTMPCWRSSVVSWPRSRPRSPRSRTDGSS